MTPHTLPLLFSHQLGAKTSAKSPGACGTAGGMAPRTSGCAPVAKDCLRNRDPVLTQMIPAMNEEGGQKNRYRLVLNQINQFSKFYMTYLLVSQLTLSKVFSKLKHILFYLFHIFLLEMNLNSSHRWDCS